MLTVRDTAIKRAEKRGLVPAKVIVYTDGSVANEDSGTTKRVGATAKANPDRVYTKIVRDSDGRIFDLGGSFGWGGGGRSS